MSRPLQKPRVLLFSSDILSVCSERDRQMLAVSRCSSVLRRSPALRTLVLSVGSGEPSAARTHLFLRTPAAQFHQSRAKASPDPNKPDSGKEMEKDRQHKHVMVLLTYIVVEWQWCFKIIGTSFLETSSVHVLRFELSGECEQQQNV